MLANMLERMARERLGVGDDWNVCVWESLPPGHRRTDTYRVTGAVKRGPKWPPLKECQQVYVSPAEADAYALAWETRTGKCHECEGSGKEVASFCCRKSKATYRPCSRCDGTGERRAGGPK